MNPATAAAAPTEIQYMMVIVPLVTAILTFILTSAFTMYKERKATNIAKRVFFDYGEFQFEYPFEPDVSESHGKGTILFGENGKKLSHNALEDYRKYRTRSLYSFLVIKNITVNDIINVKLKTVYDCFGKMVTEEFFMPVWRHADTLYIPQTVADGDSHFSENIELCIIYSTPNFETFAYSYKRKKKNVYKERLKKRYLGFIWITKVRYYQGDFYRFEKVGGNKKEVKDKKDDDK